MTQVQINQATITLIKNQLTDAFNPTILEIIDQSHLHIGHAGAKEGKGHFDLVIQSDCFNQKNRVEQHRLIYNVLDELIKTKIHALSIKIIKTAN